MHKTGLEDYYVIKGQKKMRFGRGIDYDAKRDPAFSDS